jgi:hypothetical protein
VVVVIAGFAIYYRLETGRALYVSANGNDANDGKIESKPFKTLQKAVKEIENSHRHTITVLGTLDDTSEKSDRDVSFYLENKKNKNILIRGKPNVAETEKAKLFSSRGSVVGVYLNRDDLRRRRQGSMPGYWVAFQNIEIAGSPPVRSPTVDYNGPIEEPGRKSISYLKHFPIQHAGLIVECNVVLGNGVKITHQNGIGIKAEYKSKVILNGSEISGNKSAGIVLSEEGAHLVMESGKITGNEHGVIVFDKGKFEFNGGEILQNKLFGIAAENNGIVVNNGGTITGNETDDICTMEENV